MLHLVEKARPRWRKLGELDDALSGAMKPVVTPAPGKDIATLEVNDLARRAQTQVLPLVRDSLVDRLKVVGIRINGQEPNSQVWRWWQASSLDMRQIALFRDAVGLRDGYLLVTPGPNPDAPRLAVASPLALAPEFDPFDPTAVARATYMVGAGAWGYEPDAITRFECSRPGDASSWRVAEVIEHAGGECPVVRFPNQLDSRGRSRSDIEGLIPVARRLEQIVFDRLMVQWTQSAKQRWAAGLKLKTDPKTGQPINPLRTGADQMLVNEDPAGRFGEFPAAELKGLIEAADADMATIATLSRTPPTYLNVGGAISNISADSLAALQAGFEARVDEHQELFGECVERATRIGARIVGRVDLVDEAAEVIWADLAVRSDAQRADAAVKLRSIGLPLESVLEYLGRSPQAIERTLSQAREEALAAAGAQARAFGVTPDGP